ncbi:MAG: hypothetical protein IKD88_06125 [Lachnospiraceae bacterium]|nr:hypothetical protein [Lachnospiraceae bacterium]
MSSNADYKKKYLSIAAVIVVFIVYSLIRAGHYVTVSNPSPNEIRMEAKAAREGGSGVGYLTLEDGQDIVITTDLREGSSVLVEVFIEGADGEPVQVYSDTFFVGETDTIDFTDGGEYAVRFTAHEGTTGRMTATIG